MPSAKQLLMTMTGEIHQPVRLYYQVFDQAAVVKVFSALRCMDDDRDQARWVWLYHGEAKKLKFHTAYSAIPRTMRPIVLGYCRFTSAQNMYLDMSKIASSCACAPTTTVTACPATATAWLTMVCSNGRPSRRTSCLGCPSRVEAPAARTRMCRLEAAAISVFSIIRTLLSSCVYRILRRGARQVHRSLVRQQPRSIQFRLPDARRPELK